MPRFCEALEGMELRNGWRVLDRVVPALGQTGGAYSVCYNVENADGTLGFLKAMDLTSALEAEDIPSAMKPLVDAYEFERDLLRECQGRAMSRVVLALDFGNAEVAPTETAGRVPYIIFERGTGDIRKRLLEVDRVEVAALLKVLHQVALGLRQLHSAGVAHQDLKPSNVMVFGREEETGVFSKSVESKLGDLGHAVRRGVPLVRPEHAVMGGDPKHAPPEQWYDGAPADWTTHRIGGDLYHLGSLAVFLFSRASLTAMWMQELTEDLRPGRWRGKYADVLPSVIDATERAIRRFASEVPPDIRDEIAGAVRQLCHPDPAKRGHPRSRAMLHGDPLSLEQYVTLFNMLFARVRREFIGAHR